MFGPVVDHPRFGFCVDSPALTETEPKADQAAASAKLAEYDWIILPKDLTAEDREIIATSLTDTFWDPVYQVPVRTFAEVCRYFYDRDYTGMLSSFAGMSQRYIQAVRVVVFFLVGDVP